MFTGAVRKVGPLALADVSADTISSTIFPNVCYYKIAMNVTEAIMQLRKKNSHEVNDLVKFVPVSLRWYDYEKSFIARKAQQHQSELLLEK